MANIKLTNDVKIVSDSTAIHGIDTSNVLAQYAANETAYTYTATEDCWIRAWVESPNWYQINGTIVRAYYTGGGTDILPIKKGQVVSAYTADRYSYLGARFMVFGTK